MKSLIYEVKDLINGKIYIGALKDERRFNRYRTSSVELSKLIYENPARFSIKVLKTFENVDFSEVVAEEHKLIRELVISKGWDLTYNGFYNDGVRNLYSDWAIEKKLKALRSDAVKSSISNKLKEHYKIHPNPMQGVKHSQESLIKIRETHLGKPSNRKNAVLSESTKQKIREANLGRKLTDETKLKISEANKGRPAPWLNKKMSDEIRNKMSYSAKKAWEKRKCA